MKLIVFTMALALAGCSVNQEQIDAAIKLCKPHGGVKLLEGQVHTRKVNVLCTDGTYITSKVKEKQIMGDWYDFEFRVIDGSAVLDFATQRYTKLKGAC